MIMREGFELSVSCLYLATGLFQLPGISPFRLPMPGMHLMSSSAILFAMTASKMMIGGPGKQQEPRHQTAFLQHYRSSLSPTEQEQSKLVASCQTLLQQNVLSFARIEFIMKLPTALPISVAYRERPEWLNGFMKSEFIPAICID